jgi:Fic/DOC family
MDHGITSPLPLSKRLLCEMHSILLTDVRGQEKTPGEFRRTQNWIGSRDIDKARFVPPPVTAMQATLDDRERYQHEDDGLPLLVRCGLLRYQFETIHPFLDGNGRLFITLFLIEKGPLPAPLLYVSSYFEATKEEYYDRLRPRCTANGRRTTSTPVAPDRLHARPLGGPRSLVDGGQPAVPPGRAQTQQHPAGEQRGHARQHAGSLGVVAAGGLREGRGQPHGHGHDDRERAEQDPGGAERAAGMVRRPHQGCGRAVEVTQRTEVHSGGLVRTANTLPSAINEAQLSPCVIKVQLVVHRAVIRTGSGSSPSPRIMGADPSPAWDISMAPYPP